MSASWKKIARNVGMSNLIDRTAKLEDQNVNMQVALAATVSYFGPLPKELDNQLGAFLKEAAKDLTKTVSAVVDEVVKLVKAYREANNTVNLTEFTVQDAAQLTRQQVLEGKAGEVLSVMREVV